MAHLATEHDIARLADWFCNETDPAEQNRARALLLGEETRLGARGQRLDLVEQHLAEGGERIARQRLLVDAMEADGKDASVAVTLLAGYLELQDLFAGYRNSIVDALDRNRLSELGGHGSRSRRHGLRRREIEVLYHVWRGRSSREIADILSLAERTISAHRQTICAKFGVPTGEAAIAAAIDAGVLAERATP